MAKTLTKSSARCARTTARAKSAAKARPAKPVAKSAVKAPPKSSARTVTKAAPAKPAAKKAVLTKATLAKKPPTKSSGAKQPPLKVLSKKPAPAKAPAAKSKAAAAAEASPASEAEIVGAVTGKLSGRGGAGGFSWLNTAKAEAPATEATPAAVAAPPVEEAPAPVEEAAANSVISMEEVPPVFYEEVGVVVVTVEPEPGETPADAAPEEAALAAGDDAASVPAAEPVAVEAVVEIVTMPILTADPVPAPSTGSDEARARAFKTAASQLGWSLGLQGLVFLAFCMLAKGGIPATGLAHFLANAIPLFAMLLIVGAFLTYSATQVVLDRLEGENHPLTSQRKLAHLPAQIILGGLMVVWFFIGITVWFLL